VNTRGIGLLAGVELRSPDGTPASGETFAAVRAMLARGFVVLPDGDQANVISLAPPLTISSRQLTSAVAALGSVLSDA
jgi:4-aminobutyrate aminotransferase-like enzyme